MTFRIFDDSARKEIADHIHGAPARVQNRYGSNHGTDLLTSQGDPPPYNPDPPGTYIPGGSYPPGGSNGYPPTHGPGGFVPPTPGQLLTCRKTATPSNDGKCPGPFTMDGKQYHYVKSGEGASAFCCAQEITPGSGPTVQPPSQGHSVASCPPGSISTRFASFKVSEMHGPIARGPFGGLTPAQFMDIDKKACEKFGGSYVVSATKINGVDARTLTCCKQAPASGPGTTPPVVPPQTGSGQEGPVKTDPYDGADNNTTPETPAPAQIVFRARPLADIPAGGLGWCQTEMDLTSFSLDCSKVTGSTFTTAKSTGATLPTDCKKSELPMIFARNPGASVIERGVPVIAVKDFANTTGGVQRATIVVVPCAT